MPTSLTKARATAACTALIIVASIVLVAGTAATPQVGAKPRSVGGNGNSAVAGTACERALRTIAGRMGSLNIKDQQEAYFAAVRTVS